MKQDIYLKYKTPSRKNVLNILPAVFAFTSRIARYDVSNKMTVSNIKGAKADSTDQACL